VGVFLPPERLRARLLGAYGRRPPGHTVHYCGSGVTACHNLLAHAAAGLPLGRLYAGSWSQWCADPARPAELGAPTHAAT
jgi:thiosulfate/3-mercaptopyruvate sulfurtransferase